MKTLLSLLLTLTIALFNFLSVNELSAVSPTEIVAFEPDESDYTGEHIEFEEAGFAFCLPDGWQAIEVPADCVYAAACDGAELCIMLEPEAMNDSSTITIESDGVTMDVRRPAFNGGTLLFRFTNLEPGTVSVEFAKQIISSVSEVWG